MFNILCNGEGGGLEDNNNKTTNTCSKKRLYMTKAALSYSER